MASSIHTLIRSSRHHLHSAFASRRAAFYLPAASLAAGLTGIAASFLPAAARSVFPVLHSTFLIFLPHLWNALLRWITPPCLFVLLNGIIMVLTLSSGVLKTSIARGSDFSANSLVMTETKLKSALTVESPVKDQPFVKSSVKRRLADKLPLQLAAEDQPFLKPSVKRQLSDKVPLQLAPEDGLTVVCTSVVEKTGSGSATPQLRRIRRSNSVDSAATVERESCVQDHLASPSSMIVLEVPALDNLSDEALKKKMDDFISKMNAKLRSEASV